jgi:hypothetical protein
MPRRWSVSLAALALSAASVTLAAASTASATTASNSPSAVAHAIPAGLSPGGLVHLSSPGARALATHGARNATVTSTNWSGYAAASGTFTSVSASWTQPTGSCTSSNQYAAFWVGLDGYNSSSVEQTGTLLECSGRTALYTSWYEMYPANPVYFSNTVSPGDHFTASVTYQGSNSFSLHLADTTKGWSHTVTSSLAGAARSSAEVIVEAPCCTSSGAPLPLANFHTASFTGSTANGTAIGSHSPNEIIMVNNSGADKDTISSLSSGENFSATWVRAN